MQKEETMDNKEIQRVARKCVREAMSNAGSGWNMLGVTLQWGLVVDNVMHAGLAAALAGADDAQAWQHTRALFLACAELRDNDWEW